MQAQEFISLIELWQSMYFQDRKGKQIFCNLA